MMRQYPSELINDLLMHIVPFKCCLPLAEKQNISGVPALSQISTVCQSHFAQLILREQIE